MKLLQFLKEGDGQYSSMRLVMLMWNIALLGVWIYTSIKTGAMAPIDWSALGALGIVQAGKVAQSFSEEPPVG